MTTTKIKSRGFTTTLIHPSPISDEPIYRHTEITYKDTRIIKVDTDTTPNPVALRFFKIDGTIIRGREFCAFKETFWNRHLIGFMIGKVGDKVEFITNNTVIKYVCGREHGWIVTVN